MKSQTIFFAALFFSLTALIIPVSPLLANQETSNDNENDVQGYSQFSFSLNGGSLISFTDIKENDLLPDSEELAFGGGLSLNFHRSPVLTLQTSFMYGELVGISTKDNLRYDTELGHALLTANVSINRLLAPQSNTGQWMNIYGFTGVGALMFNAKLTELDTGNLLKNAYEEGEGEWHNGFVIPFGLGLNFKLSDRIDLGIKSSFQYAFLDELDAHVVDDSRKDMYNYTSVGLTLRLGSNPHSKDWAPVDEVMYPGDLNRMERMEARAAELEQELDATEDQYSEDMDAVRDDLDEVSQEQVQLSGRVGQLFGALEDVSQQIIRLEEEMAKETEEFFSVQVMAIKEDMSVEEAHEALGANIDLEKHHVDGWYKYISGRFETLEAAKLHMQRIWGQGIKDAFIVKYDEGLIYPR
ncbi:MAG: hypothetical protein ACQESL_01720 [Bacteroidota bacterium]